MRILDLSVPSEPKWAGAYYPDAPVRDVAWFGRFACATVGWWLEELSGLEVIDLSDFNRPARTAKVTLPRANYVALMGSYACVTGGA